MERNNDVSKMLSMVQNMSSEDKMALVNQILGMISSVTGQEKKDSCAEMVQKQLKEKPNCPHCWAESKLGYIVKKGFEKDTQRYYCKSCKAILNSQQQ